MQHLKLKLIAALFAALGALPAAHAAGSTDLSGYYDPNPAADDVARPMPCGLKMVFRKVYTSASAQRMADKTFSAGLQQTASPLASSVNARHLQGSFHDDKGYYYLMGKYEVSAMQYQALMADDGKCPAAKPPLKRPQNLVSWFEAQEAARRLTLYLAANDKSVKQDGALAFVRLPTDSEYEYALRGGHAVSPAVFAAPLFFDSGSLADYAWHQSPQSANGRLNAIGRLKPNPLGIYDLLGNVQEMTQDQFYASRLGRLHGQSGGFTARGGSYLTQAQDMTAALRVEKPFYTAEGKEFRAEDTGFRFVLALPVIKSSEELKELSAQVQELGYETDGREGELLKQLDEIMRSKDKLGSEKESLSEQVGELNAALGKLRQDLVTLNAERDEERSRAIVSALRLGGFLCSSLSDHQAVLLLDTAAAERDEKRLKTVSSESLKGRLQTIAEASRAKLQDTQSTLDYLASYLADHLTDSGGLYTQKQLAAQAGNAKLSLGSGTSNLGVYIDEFVKIAETLRKETDLSGEKLRTLLIDKCYARYPYRDEIDKQVKLMARSGEGAADAARN